MSLRPAGRDGGAAAGADGGGGGGGGGRWRAEMELYSCGNRRTAPAGSGTHQACNQHPTARTHNHTTSVVGPLILNSMLPIVLTD